jgi:hypothetical protein
LERGWRRFTGRSSKLKLRTDEKRSTVNKLISNSLPFNTYILLT